MTYMWDEKNSGRKVLYHAVSSYQLLEVLLHKMTYHSEDKAVLILPDFITKKYPQYRKLKADHFFDQVYLFPYLHIHHREEEEILKDTVKFYGQYIPCKITEFDKIYVAGAHFYFSLYLLLNQIPFIFFEDAAGMLSRWEELGEGLKKKFPVHGEIAGKYGLFNGSNPCVERIICLKKAQTIDVSDPIYENFSVEESLEKCSVGKRKKLIHFFLKKRIRTKAQAILLTQQFSNLGYMTEQEQYRLYTRVKEQMPKKVRVIIKKHPDDSMNYSGIFPEAEVIKETFPSELLPYVFWKKPRTLYSVNSTGCENLENHFIIRKLGKEEETQ